MSPPRLDADAMRAKIDHLEKLVMTNLPRIASLEHWQRDMTKSVHTLQDWAKDRRFELAAHDMRIRQTESHFPFDDKYGIDIGDEPDGPDDLRRSLPAPAPAMVCTPESRSPATTVADLTSLTEAPNH